MRERINIVDLLTYCLLFIAIFTSNNWLNDPTSAEGELIRFDRLFFLGQFNIYHIFAILFFVILLFIKSGMFSSDSVPSNINYLKNIFWLYFIPVNILVYLAIYTKDIPLIDLGIAPIVILFLYLCFTYFFQDVFFANKNKEKLVKVLTIFQLIIFLRSCYSIIKYFLNFGTYILFLDSKRLGQENDFADFFILLFIISLARLLFCKKDKKYEKTLNIMGIITASYISIFSFRRYIWVELLIAITIILFFYYLFSKIDINKKIMTVCIIFSLLFSTVIILGPDKFIDNYYVGRLLTSLSLINKKFESKYGTDMTHTDEILDGWDNVKENWILGLTEFGGDKMKRTRIKAAHRDSVFVHCGYFHVWLLYGFLGFLLFLLLYFKTLKLGYTVFLKMKDQLGVIGLIVLTFMVSQIFKNIVWPTAITYINITIIYIFLISLTLRIKQLT